jgi:hypothetical protein
MTVTGGAEDGGIILSPERLLRNADEAADGASRSCSIDFNCLN